MIGFSSDIFASFNSASFVASTTPIAFPAIPLGEIPEQAGRWFDVFLRWFAMIPREWWIAIIIIGVVLIVLRKVIGGLLRTIRRQRPANIHPLLQKYNVDRGELQKQQRTLAAGIEATSTGARLVGYRLVRQVEAVFVEGYTTPEDAMIALKATAVERGANAILNVRTERTTAGRCTAGGDAVVAERIDLPRSPRSPSPAAQHPPTPPVADTGPAASSSPPPANSDGPSTSPGDSRRSD